MSRVFLDLCSCWSAWLAALEMAWYMSLARSRTTIFFPGIEIRNWAVAACTSFFFLFTTSRKTVTWLIFRPDLANFLACFAEKSRIPGVTIMVLDWTITFIFPPPLEHVSRQIIKKSPAFLIEHTALKKLVKCTLHYLEIYPKSPQEARKQRESKWIILWDRSPAFQGARQGNSIGILNICADR